jgi:hypothetical protein
MLKYNGSMNVEKGTKFNRITIIEFAKLDQSNRPMYYCECICGMKKIIRLADLKSGRTKSCGCFKLDIHTKHGQSHSGGASSEYYAYRNMIARCYNPNIKNYHRWGGRGIKVCERWLGENGFNTFFEDMGMKPTKKHSLDRFPNNDGDYEPKNCRWATEEEQKRNQSSNRWYEYEGERMILKDWAAKLGEKDKRLHSLLKTRTFEEVVLYCKKYPKRSINKESKDCVGSKKIGKYFAGILLKTYSSVIDTCKDGYNHRMIYHVVNKGKLHQGFFWKYV